VDSLHEDTTAKIKVMRIEVQASGGFTSAILTKRIPVDPKVIAKNYR
jgi:hypothetical protein